MVLDTCGAPEVMVFMYEYVEPATKVEKSKLSEASHILRQVDKSLSSTLAFCIHT